MDIQSIYGITPPKNVHDMSLDALLQELSQTRELCSNLDQIIENSIDGIFITDGNAVAIRINQAYERISGLKREDLLGKNNRELVLNGVISVSCAVIVTQQKKPITQEQFFLTTGKKALNSCNPIFDSEGNLIMTVSNIRDLTELEDMRTRLYEEEARATKYREQLDLIKEKLVGNAKPVAEDPKMIAVLNLAQKIAKTDVSTLILGETGVGKDEVAKFIHRNSARRDGPYIEINCAAIPSNLVESELFGYEKGSFTGAKQGGKQGLFHMADGGTVFLDEIGELPLEVQAKLLRFIQSGSFIRVGGNTSIRVDARVIAATNRDLQEMVQRKLFRDDLYYRLNVVEIKIPPLRERPRDIIPLTNHFLETFNQKYGLTRKFSSGIYHSFMNYDWPGNVRELKNTIERLVVLSEDAQITAADLPAQVLPLSAGSSNSSIQMKDILQRLEYDYMLQAYRKFQNVRAAGKYLGISAATFVRKMKLYREKYPF